MTELNNIGRILDNLSQSAGATKDITGRVKRQTPEIMGQVDDILEKLQEVSRLLSQAMQNVPEISDRAREGMRDVNDILESVKKNFLIRGNLPKKPEPKTHGLEIRGN
jgi:methyl-accepting chemotaxis protein